MLGKCLHKTTSLPITFHLKCHEVETLTPSALLNVASYSEWKLVMSLHFCLHTPQIMFSILNQPWSLFTPQEFASTDFNILFFLPKSWWRHIGPPLTDSPILHLSHQIRIDDSLYTVPHLVLCLNILCISWLTPFNRLKNWDLEILKVQRKGPIWSSRAGLYDMSVWIH